jgi:hypothetical protein
MKTIERRLNNLEHRLGIAKNKVRFIVTLHGCGTRGLNDDRCVQILDEAGFLDTGGSVDFTQIPNGLDAKETERFVRENGAKICGRGQRLEVGLR